eukprot:4137282-Prymnesium_polylepis.1
MAEIRKSAHVYRTAVCSITLTLLSFMCLSIGDSRPVADRACRTGRMCGAGERGGVDRCDITIREPRRLTEHSF